MTPKAALTTLAGVLVLGFSVPAAAQPGPQPAARVKATLGRNFDPPTVTIRVGDTVEWKNTAFFTHTVTFDPAKAKDPADVELPAGAAPFDSGPLGGGKTYSHTFTVPGRYRYVCLPHEGHGMRGVVIVLPAGG